MTQLMIPFILYLVGLFVIAYLSNKKTSTFNDFAIGSRSLSSPVAALSAGASDMSGWLLMGLPGAIYLSGLVESWIVLGLIIGAWLNWTLVAKRLRIASVLWEDVYSLPEFFKVRVAANGITIEVVGAIAIVLFFAFYVSAGFIACATLFQDVFGWNYLIALGCSVGVVMLYTSLGGFLAVSWTDTFQALLMLFVLILVPTLAWSLSNDTITEATTKTVWNLGSASPLAILGLLAWGLGYFGQPHILKRFMALKNPGDVKQARRIGMSWMILSSFGALLVGCVGMMVLPNIDNPETVLIKLSEVVLSPWIAGIVIAAIMSAAMSTVDSQLMVVSTTLVNSRVFKEEHVLPLSRVAVIVVGTMAALLALDPESTVFGTVSLAWAGIGASIGPAVLFCLFHKNTTNYGLIAGVLTGMVTTVIWYVLGKIFPETTFGTVYALLPSFVLSCIAIWITSQFKLDLVARERFDTFKIALHSKSTS